MKKRTMMITACIMAVSMAVTGCGHKISNEYVEVEGYKGIETPKIDKPKEATDKEVKQYLDLLLDQDAKESDVTDRAVQDGDVAVIDFEGKMNGETFDGGSSQDYELEIGSGQFIEGFEDSVVGHNIGDSYDWEGTFPDPYPNQPDFAGKPVTFTITVKAIKEKTKPELNDEYVKSVSEKSKTVEEYKKEIKKNLSEERKQQYEYSVQDAAWQAVLEKAKIKKYPDKEIKKEKDKVIKQWKDVSKEQGVEYEEFVSQQTGGTSVKDFEKQLEDQVKDMYKTKLVVEAIAEKEKLEPSKEEYGKELKVLAKENGFPDVDTLKQFVDKDQLKDLVMHKIVVEWVSDNRKQAK